MSFGYPTVSQRKRRVLRKHKGKDMKNRLSEEDIKTQIGQIFFKNKLYTIEKNRLDFAIKDKQSGMYLYWAESKKGSSDQWKMLSQLILTIHPRLIGSGIELPPQFLGCFDAQNITFVEFHHIQDILQSNEINWKERPSSVSPRTIEKVRGFLDHDQRVHTFDWHQDQSGIKEFITHNFTPLSSGVAKIQITKNNFVQVYNRWQEKVLPFIDIPSDLDKEGIIGGDFFLADLLSKDNMTIIDKLKVLLQTNQYHISKDVEGYGRLLLPVSFKDKNKRQQAHQQFWGYYERPPQEEYQRYILKRRDLLVPSGIRERKGAFFTPKIWVEKSQKYLERVFGENWQEEYSIWDCCAGTGNLEEGLTNPEQIWMSTLDENDVGIMKDNPRLYDSHIFQFDFLNDSFEKLPDKLKEIIKNKPEQLIIYINPPYAEPTDFGSRKVEVNISMTYKKFKDIIGSAVNELFAQFIVRVYTEIPQAKLALFSTLKYIVSSNFIQFRTFFKAQYQGGFVVRANTFDNVKGNFPIGFLIWDLSQRQEINSVVCDVIDNDGIKIWEKMFYTLEKKGLIINDWIRQFYDKTDTIGYLCAVGSDFQHNSSVYFATTPTQNDIKKHLMRMITKKNLPQMAIYLAVRHCIPHSWLNHNDQFLYPNEGWKQDLGFQHDCLIFALFYAKNRTVSLDGVNHWIPFRPKDVGSRDDFTSNFMSSFIKGIEWSPEAQAVLDAGREIWKYYHTNNPDHLNAGLYEIREYFRGQTESGRLRSKSDDLEFQQRDDSLKDALNALTEKIVDKVYAYEFLKGE